MRILSVILVVFVAMATAHADCQDLYRLGIEHRQGQLLHFKRSNKRILKGTFIGTGATTGVLTGAAFLAITDGATIPIAILQGALFGTVIGGAATGAVAIPLITYQQVRKAQIRGLTNALNLLEEIRSGDLKGPVFSKLYRKLSKHNSELDRSALANMIEKANTENAFCRNKDEPENLDSIQLFRMRQIRRFLLSETQQRSKDL